MLASGGDGVQMTEVMKQTCSEQVWPSGKALGW